MFDQEIAWLLKEKYHGKKTSEFFEDKSKLETGEPLAYIIGSIPFLDTIINLDSRPLIPRTETEYWTLKVIDEISVKQKNSPLPLHILDLCAGSGCIGVAIAKALPGVKVDFAELEGKHLLTIEKNCQNNKVSAQDYRIFQSNLFTVSPEAKLGKYDFIVSNPPYIDPALNRAEISVKEFEPAVALYGGNEGMDTIKKIITESLAYLNPGGQLWLEHEPEQVKSIEILAQSNFIITSYPDQYHMPRFSKLVLQ